jgi:hypothetical protein
VTKWASQPATSVSIFVSPHACQTLCILFIIVVIVVAFALEFVLYNTRWSLFKPEMVRLDTASNTVDICIDCLTQQRINPSLACSAHHLSLSLSLSLSHTLSYCLSVHIPSFTARPDRPSVNHKNRTFQVWWHPQSDFVVIRILMILSPREQPTCVYNLQ